MIASWVEACRAPAGRKIRCGGGPGTPSAEPTPFANEVVSVAAATRPTETRTCAPSASGPTTYFSSEIETLRNLFEEAAAGRGRMVLLSGEAGIGKTRTANELATYASSRGAEVLVGRCYEGAGAPAYWPWIQVLRAYLRRWKAEVGVFFGGVGADSTDDEIRAIAPNHPVFLLD